ncbi:MAG: MFS transporter [Myxococcaceae bacterium]|nr:MFS transporter [Myxococcaceae bacterium]MCA3010873.1 MFS transporter [Myxococcaceae bacterium]
MSAFSSYLEVLRRRPAYRRLWLGSVVSLAGDWFTLIALYSLLDEYTGSGAAVGLMLFVRFLPAALLGPLAGVVADRFPRRRVMVACDVARALIVMGFLLVRDGSDVWLLYLLTFAQMTAASFFDPAEQAAIASTVAPDEVVTANTLQGITWSAMLSFGALAGGATAALVGRDVSFVVNALTYVASALFIRGADVPFTPKARPATWRATLGLDDLRDGLARLRADAWVRRTLWVKTSWAIPGGGALLLYAVLGRREFGLAGQPELGVGVLLGMRGVGAFLGPLIARRLGGDTPAFLERAIGLGYLVTALFWVAFACAPTLPVAAVMLALAHTGTSTQWVFSSSLLNLQVEDGMRGRIFAVDFMSYMLMLGLSSWLAGAVLDVWHVPPRALMACLSGVLLLTAAVWSLLGHRGAPAPASLRAPPP